MALVAATNGFVPTSEGLTSACELLTISRNPLDPRYAATSSALEQQMVQPLFIVHLAYIFSRLTPSNIPDDVRQLAGLVLKTGVSLAPLKALTEDVQVFVRAELLVALTDPHSVMVRKLAGSVISTLASSHRIAGGLAAWPGLLPTLFHLLDGGGADPTAEAAAAAAGGAAEAAAGGLVGASGALACMAKLCEDQGRRLGPDVIDALAPRLIPFFACAGDAECRLYSVVALQHLVSAAGSMGEFPPGLGGGLGGVYLQGLSSLTNDPSPPVRVAVCQSIVTLLNEAPHALLPAFGSVGEFMLQALADPASPQDLALAALEFWVPCCKNTTELGAGSDGEPLLVGFLPRLIPVLLQGVVHSAEEVADLEGETQDDGLEPDRPEDLRPLFRKQGKGKGSSSSGSGAGKNGSGALGGGGAAGLGIEAADGDDDGGGEDEDDDEDDEDDEEEEEVESYTLRKRCASTLDVVTERFGDTVVLPLVLPELEVRLRSDSVWVREAAFLALGALSTGCSQGLESFLPQLFPYLLEHMGHPTCSALREICCWAVGRYMPWACQQAWVGEGVEDVDVTKLQPLTHALLQRISDPNKKVQQYACSTFAIYVEALEESGCEAVLKPPNTRPIFEHLFTALSSYQTKSGVIMLDTIGTLCEAVAEDLETDHHLCSAFLPSLMAKWDATGDFDKLVFPLFECVGCVAAATKLNFQAYALPVLQRCCRMIESVLLADATDQADPTTGDPFDKAFVASALDVIDGLVRGIEGNFATLLASATAAAAAAPGGVGGGVGVGGGGGQNLLSLLAQCLDDEEDEVRQYALALLGDLAQHSPLALVDATTGAPPRALVPVLGRSMTLIRGRKVCSNAVWALGEFAVAFGEPCVGGADFVNSIVPLLAALLGNEECHPNLLSNAATTLGRIALVCPDLVAPHCPGFAEHWLLALQEVGGNDERDQCFKGLATLAQHAWQPLVAERYSEFLRAVASWSYYDFEPEPPVQAALQQLISAASQQLAAGAAAVIAAGGDGAAVDPMAPLGQVEENYREYLVQTYTFA